MLFSPCQSDLCSWLSMQSSAVQHYAAAAEKAAALSSSSCWLHQTRCFVAHCSRQTYSWASGHETSLTKGCGWHGCLDDCWHALATIPIRVMYCWYGCYVWKDCCWSGSTMCAAGSVSQDDWRRVLVYERPAWQAWRPCLSSTTTCSAVRTRRCWC